MGRRKIDIQYISNKKERTVGILSSLRVSPNKFRLPFVRGRLDCSKKLTNLQFFVA